MNNNISKWIVEGEVGISSKTMWVALMDVETTHNNRGFYFDIPYDPDDFSRCYQLVKDCEVTKEDLKKVEVRFPWWKPFIKNWDKLVEMYESKDFTSLYKFMQSLVEQTKNIAPKKVVEFI